MLSQPLKFLRRLNKTTKILVGVGLALGLSTIIFTSLSRKGFDKKAHLAQTTYQEKIICKFTSSPKNIVWIDTFTKTFNAQNQLIAENDAVFYEYNSKGALSQIITCMNEDCDRFIEKKILHKDTIAYNLYDRIFQLQKKDEYFRTDMKQFVASQPYITHKDTSLNSKIRKVSHFFYTDADTLQKTIYLHYDSLQRLHKAIYETKGDYYVEKIFSYNSENQIVGIINAVKSATNELYAKYYQICSYDHKKRLQLVQTFKMPDSTLQSQTEYQYLSSKP